MYKYGITMKNNDCYVVLSELKEEEFIKTLCQAKWSILQLTTPSRIHDQEIFLFDRIVVSMENIEYIALMESEE